MTYSIAIAFFTQKSATHGELRSNAYHFLTYD